MHKKLRLHNPKLQFVPYGKGKIHARWDGIIPASGVDISHFTMCGRVITAEMQPMSEREIATERICGNCRQSLMTYGPQVELVSESEMAIHLADFFEAVAIIASIKVGVLIQAAIETEEAAE